MRLHVSVSEDSGGGPGDEGGGGNGRCNWQRTSPQCPYHEARRRSPPASRSRSQSMSHSPFKSRSCPRSRSESKSRSRSRSSSESKSRSESDIQIRKPAKRNLHSSRKYLASSSARAPRHVGGRGSLKSPKKKRSSSPARASQRKIPAHKKAHSPSPTSQQAGMHRPATEVPQCLCWSHHLSRLLHGGADDSASTMYLSPPDQLTAQGSADLEMLMGMLRCRANAQGELRHPAPPCLDPLLEQYVVRLLAMSKTNVESLKVSSSNVSVRSEVVACQSNTCTAQTQTQTSVLTSSHLPRAEDTGDGGQRSVGVAVSPERLFRPCFSCPASRVSGQKVLQPCLVPTPVSSPTPTTTLVHSPAPTSTSVPVQKPFPPKTSSIPVCPTRRLCPAASRLSKPVLAAKQSLQKPPLQCPPSSPDAPLDTTKYSQHQLFTGGSFRCVPTSALPANPELPHLSPNYRPLAVPAAAQPLRVGGGTQADDSNPSARSGCPELCCPCDIVPDDGPQAMQKAWRSVASDVIKMSERCAQRIESLARLIEHVRLEKDKLAHLDAKPESQQTVFAPVSAVTAGITAYSAAAAAVAASASTFGGRSSSPVYDAAQTSPCSVRASSGASCSPCHTPPQTPPCTPPHTPTCCPPRNSARSSPTASPPRCLRISPDQAMAETAEDTNKLWCQRLQRRPMGRQNLAASTAPRSPQRSPVRLTASPSSSPQRTALSSPQRVCIPTTCPHTVPISTLRIPSLYPRSDAAAAEQKIFENDSSLPQSVQEVPDCNVGNGDPLRVFTPVDTIPAPIPEPCVTSCNVPYVQERGRSLLRSKPPPSTWGPRVPHAEQHELSAIPEVDSTLTTDVSHRRSSSPVHPPQSSPISQLVDIVSGEKTTFFTGPRENLHGLLIATHMAAQESQPWALPCDSLSPGASTSARPPCLPSQLPRPQTPPTHSPRGQSPIAHSSRTQSPNRSPRARSPSAQSPCHQNVCPPCTCAHSPTSHAQCICSRRISSPHQQCEDDDDPDIVAELIRRGVLKSPFAWMKRAESAPQSDGDVNLSMESEAYCDFVSDLLNSGSSPEQQRQRGGADAPPSLQEGLTSSQLPADGTSPLGDVLPEDLEGMFERLGLGWAATMLRKTQEAMAISSSSSDTSRGAMRPFCGGGGGGGGGGNTSGPLAQDGMNRTDAGGTSFVPRRGHSTPVEVTTISDGSASVSWQRGHATETSDICSVPGASSQELSTPSVSLVVKSKNKSASRT